MCVLHVLFSKKIPIGHEVTLWSILYQTSLDLKTRFNSPQIFLDKQKQAPYSLDGWKQCLNKQKTKSLSVLRTWKRQWLPGWVSFLQRILRRSALLPPSSFVYPLWMLRSFDCIDKNCPNNPIAVMVCPKNKRTKVGHNGAWDELL